MAEVASSISAPPPATLKFSILRTEGALIEVRPQLGYRMLQPAAGMQMLTRIKKRVAAPGCPAYFPTCGDSTNPHIKARKSYEIWL